MVRRIDPYSLRLFVAAAQAGSIARAAAREHIAASALSRRLADLEAAFGVPLFVRSPRGIELTEGGRIALAGGTRLDQSLQALVREVQSHAGEVCGTLRLFANASAVVGFLPERLNAFLAKHRLVEIALQERVTEESVRACLDDEADIGVGVAMEVPTTLESWHFANDPLTVVLPADHELAQQPSLRFADIIRHPIVSITSGGMLDRMLHAQAAAAHGALRISVSVSSFDAVCRMVEAGLGIAVIPGRAAAAIAAPGRIVRRPLNESWVNRELRVYALRKNPRLRAVEALIDALVE